MKFFFKFVLPFLERTSWCSIIVEVKNGKLYLYILLTGFKNHDKKREKILSILFVCQFATKGQKSTQNTEDNLLWDSVGRVPK